MNDLLKTFFQSLPTRIKVVLHLFELLLCFYAATSVALLFTPLADFVKPYLEIVAVAFLLLFPIVHVLVEFAFGQPKPPGTELSDKVGERVTDALLNVLNSANKITVETDKTTKPGNGKS